MRLDLQHTQNEVPNNARWLQWEAFIYKYAPHNVNSPGLWGFRRFAAASAISKASSRASPEVNKQILFCIFRWPNTAYLANKDSCHSNVLCLNGSGVSSGVWSVVPTYFFSLSDGHLIIPIYRGTEAAWPSQRPHGCLYIWQMFSSDSLYFKGCGIQLVRSPPADGTVLHYMCFI